MNTKDYLPAVALTLLGILGATQLTWPKVQTAQVEQTRLEGEITRLSADAAALPVEQAREVKLTQEYADLESTLPDDEELPKVLATLETAAVRLGVITGKISRTVRASEVAGVTAIDLDLDIKGSYARTQAFIQTLAALPRSYTTRGVNLTASEDGNVSGSLKLTTYKRDSTPTPPPVDPALSGAPTGAVTPATGTPPGSAASPTATPGATPSVVSTPQGGTR